MQYLYLKWFSVPVRAYNSFTSHIDFDCPLKYFILYQIVQRRIVVAERHSILLCRPFFIQEFSSHHNLKIERPLCCQAPNFVPDVLEQRVPDKRLSTCLDHQAVVAFAFPTAD